MPYTLLKVTESGVVLLEYHLRRLGLSDGERTARKVFAHFLREAPAGVWAVRVVAFDGIEATRRPGSRLFDGMPTRLAPSPIASHAGTIPKPASPSPFDAVRLPGVATLLTSPNGREIYEACSASVIGWDGAQLVCVPSDRPRVWSTTEAAIREHLQVREGPIGVESMPILLVNAVKGTCAVAGPSSLSFPEKVRGDIEALLVTLTVWP